MPPPGAPMADLAIQDRESSSQDTLGGTLTDTITVVNNGPGDGDRRRPHGRAGRRRAGGSDRARSVHVQLGCGRPVQPGRARTGCERDPRGPRATAAPGSADRRRHRQRRRVRSELRQRLGEDRRHRHTRATAAKVRIVPIRSVASRGSRRLRGHGRGDQAGPGSEADRVRDAPEAATRHRAPGAVAAAGGFAGMPTRSSTGRRGPSASRPGSSRHGSSATHSRCTPGSPGRISPPAVRPPPCRYRRRRWSPARRAQAPSHPAGSPADPVAAGARGTCDARPSRSPPSRRAGRSPPWFPAARSQ